MSHVVAILGLLFLILIHEAGHFFVALAVRMRPRKFYVGFPPALVKRVHNGIEYGLGVIPLGGYVRIPGMHRPAAKDAQLNFAAALKEDWELQAPVEAVERHLEAEDHVAARAALGPLVAAVEDAELSRAARRGAERGLRDLEESLGDDAYWRQPTWKRVAVILAGPGVNVLFAIAIFTAAFALGVPNGNTREVVAVNPGTPAEVVGLKPHDVIVAVNGKATPTFEKLRQALQSSDGKAVSVVVKRNGARVQLPAHRPVRSGNRWILGFQPAIAYKSYSLPAATAKAGEQSWYAIRATGQAIGGLFQQQQRSQLTSVYGIEQASAETIQVGGLRAYLPLLAYISLALALLNLLPLLPLDGGHILFSLIEGVRRRAVAREVYERASVIGFALIMLVFLIALNNDISGAKPG